MTEGTVRIWEVRYLDMRRRGPGGEPGSSSALFRTEHAARKMAARYPAGDSLVVERRVTLTEYKRLVRQSRLDS